MSTFPYKNPISSEQLNGVQSVQRSEVFGTNFSVLSVGGYMEVFNLSDLVYTINGLGPIEYSGNTIPIDFLKGTGDPWSPDVLTLNSDNISSGRRRLGMLAYVYEVDQVYQYRIDNYESLWTAATASTGTVVISDFGTTVYNTSPAGQNFINAWTASTIEDISGYTHSTAVWKKYTISADTSGELKYYISASTPTEIIKSGDRWFNTNTGVELVWIDDGDSQQWIQPFSVPGPLSPDVGYYATTGITTGQTLTWDKTYWGISGNSNVDLVLPSVVGKEGYYLIIKDEAGICGTYRIRITPLSGTIDNNNYVDMNINYMSLTCMIRGGNWYLI